MPSLTWDQVNAWRLSQQHLLQRADRKHLLKVVSDVCGVQAQVMSAAELVIWARVDDITPADVQSALWEQRTLVKTWAMRGTLHLLTAEDFPLYIAALSTLKHFRRGSWLKYHGVTIAELEAIIEGVNATLNGTGMTREQLADTLAERVNAPKLREILNSGWGAVLKPVAFQGYLCFGPSEGQTITFVHPRQWLGEWTPLDSETALKEVVRRFLTAYGPATVDELDRWFGMEPSAARRLIRSLSGEIEAVEVEGWQAWALVSTLKQIAALKAAHTVRLLPNFDPYTIAVARRCQYLLPEAHKGRVYRPQGWISPVVLVDGRIAGVWEYDNQRARVIVKVDLFDPQTDQVKQGIEAEAKRLGSFLGTDAQLVYA